ncbi:hypothetical protein PPERSA_03929 [Pseudocohnilembus persalinus]|uniref:Uncharacterized protein n=1 Tax=Pseudocohnilembus persalinus TaxID=266149 RepID=A0A0V0R5W7_PSEPJ|nr:hypothetical protein PPERSA_03929 [Pseudocohnilembus persalinus]|eukprot:KRX09867.1 hypothetical protein PPERSA_03929 [Pseudocohnilembus persalinus]
MSKLTLISLTFILCTLFSQVLCDDYKIKSVDDWDSSDISTLEDLGLLYLYHKPANCQSLQISDTKIVTLVQGLKAGQNAITNTEQLTVNNLDGSLHKKIDSTPNYYYILGKTNVEGEFVTFNVNSNDKIEMNFYNEDLEITRNIENEVLPDSGNFDGFYEISSSVGNDLLYLVVNAYNNVSQKENYLVYVLDLSDTSTYTLKYTDEYTDYVVDYYYALSVQAYSDDTANIHFWANNDNGEQTFVQLQYDSKGKLKSGYPKELDDPIDLDTDEFWKPITQLHSDEKTATFLLSDTDNLLIYTFEKNGDKVCSKTIDISDYNNMSNFYGIHGDQGWLYLQDDDDQQGNFFNFDPENCSLDLDDTIKTDIYSGVAGSFVIKEKIRILEIGNEVDTNNQNYVNYQIHTIGSYNDDDDNGDNGVILGFQVIIAIIGLVVFI